MLDYRNLIVFLLILALFLGATVEISEGSILIGIILFVAIAILISRIKMKKTRTVKPSRYCMFIGLLILLADIVYNVKTGSKLGTLDVMTFFLGSSLIAQDLGRENIQRMGVFGTYMSAVFIVLFLIFFSLFNYLNINFIHAFDHYFVMLPSISIIKAFGVPVNVVTTETVRIQGVEDLNVVIGGPCSGLYSMFLLISTIVAYTRIEKVGRKTALLLLVVAVVVAYIANLIRVSILYTVGFLYGNETMMFVHEHLGWVIFVVVVMLFLSVLDRLSRPLPDQKQNGE